MLSFLQLKKYKTFRLRVFADEYHPHLSQLGKDPVSLFEPPVYEEEVPPEFDGIEEFEGTEEEVDAIRTYGSSWRVGEDGERMEYGIYNEEDHPEDKDAPTEFDD